MYCSECNTYLIPVRIGILEEIFYCTKCKKKIKVKKAIRLPENAEITCTHCEDERQPRLQVKIPKPTYNFKVVNLHPSDKDADLKSILKALSGKGFETDTPGKCENYKKRRVLQE